MQLRYAKTDIYLMDKKRQIDIVLLCQIDLTKNKTQKHWIDTKQITNIDT